MPHDNRGDFGNTALFMRRLGDESLLDTTCGRKADGS
jgi:hypothetical protein